MQITKYNLINPRLLYLIVIIVTFWFGILAIKYTTENIKNGLSADDYEKIQSIADIQKEINEIKDRLIKIESEEKLFAKQEDMDNKIIALTTQIKNESEISKNNIISKLENTNKKTEELSARLDQVEKQPDTYLSNRIELLKTSTEKLKKELEGIATKERTIKIRIIPE